MLLQIVKKYSCGGHLVWWWEADIRGIWCGGGRLVLGAPGVAVGSWYRGHLVCWWEAGIGGGLQPPPCSRCPHPLRSRYWHGPCLTHTSCPVPDAHILWRAVTDMAHVWPIPPALFQMPTSSDEPLLAWPMSGLQPPPCSRCPCGLVHVSWDDYEFKNLANIKDWMPGKVTNLLIYNNYSQI